MDDLSPMVFCTVLLVFAGIGIVHVSFDYRYFDYVKEDCEKRGYIQNETIRINCSVEKQHG